MNFLGIDALEIVIILLIAYLVLGPARMLELARSFGKFIQEVRSTASELPDLLALEEASKETTTENDSEERSVGG